MNTTQTHGPRDGWFDGYVVDEEVFAELPFDDVSEWEWD